MVQRQITTSKVVLRKVVKTYAASPNEKYFFNRNPRNLEQMTIGYKPAGYPLETTLTSFWHKLTIQKTNQGVLAKIIHFENGTILQAGSAEWVVKKHLYKTNDTCAYINLARILARRCLEAGIYQVECGEKVEPNTKVHAFIQTLENNGIALKESKRYNHVGPTHWERPEKPWEVIVD